MEEQTFERGLEQAVILKQMTELALELDCEYLEQSLTDMKATHSMRDSMMILNPNPFGHTANQDLNAAKIKQLENFLAIAKTVKEIQEAEAGVKAAQRNVNQLNRLFGV